jgi:putative membrane protein
MPRERLLLWLKAVHVMAMVTWFAGLFYLPRLFVYHADASDPIGVERFRLMERRLFAIMTVGAVATVVFGSALLIAFPPYLAMGWVHVKLALVALLIAYHGYCYKLMRDFAQNRNARTARWYRLFNEVPSLFLIAIVALAVVKPF